MVVGKGSGAGLGKIFDVFPVQQYISTRMDGGRTMSDWDSFGAELRGLSARVSVLQPTPEAGQEVHDLILKLIAVLSKLEPK